MSNLENWKKLADKASNIAGTAKESRDTKADLFNQLAFMSLKIYIAGKVQDKQALAQAVSKSGPFSALRQCVSNAKPLALHIEENNNINVEEGRGKNKTKKVFSKDEILKAEEPLFTVSSVYRAMLKASQDTDQDTTITEDDALQAYAANSGMSVKEIKDAYDAEMLADAIKQGFTILEEEKKAVMIENASHIAAQIEKQFEELFAVAPDVATKLAENLQNKTAKKENTKVKKAA